MTPSSCTCAAWGTVLRPHCRRTIDCRRTIAICAPTWRRATITEDKKRPMTKDEGDGDGDRMARAGMAIAPVDKEHHLPCYHLQHLVIGISSSPLVSHHLPCHHLPCHHLQHLIIGILSSPLVSHQLPCHHLQHRHHHCPSV